MSDTLESLRARIKELETQLAGAQQGALIGPLAQRLGIRSEAMEDFEGRYRRKFAAESDPPSDEALQENVLVCQQGFAEDVACFAGWAAWEHSLRFKYRATLAADFTLLRLTLGLALGFTFQQLLRG